MRAISSTDWARHCYSWLLMFTDSMDGNAIHGRSENSDYWYFVVVTGLLNFVFVYLLPVVSEALHDQSKAHP